MAAQAFTEYTVRLFKPTASAMVGMTLAMFARDGDSPEPHPRIHHLHSQGLAAASGEIRIDDQLVSVNGQHTDTDVLASALIRDAVGEVLLTLRRELTSSDFSVVLERTDPSVRLGMLLATRQEAGADGALPPVIHMLESDGLAALSGELRPGDVVKAINGTPVTSDEHAKQLISAAPGAITLLVSRPDAAAPTGVSRRAKSSLLQASSHGDALEVKLLLGARDRLGITVGATEDGNAMVAAMAAGSVAHSSGVIAVGDTILAVNGEGVSTEEEARSKMRAMLGEVSLSLLPTRARPAKVVPAFWT
mmetsp:Transcript_15879/g.39790  ORF Transcript_15879/g.39790 Transcript_15879/m.39790 type:complete len:306 (-) Transcript_15879:168-1085(-)